MMNVPAAGVAAPIRLRLAGFLVGAAVQAILLIGSAAVFTDLSFSTRALVAGLLIISAGYSIGFVGFTSSTPGKMAMGMWVSDSESKRVLPDRAILRYLVLALPNLVLLGALRGEERISVIAWLVVTALLILVNAGMAAREGHRALHDRIAGPRVISGRPPEIVE